MLGMIVDKCCCELMLRSDALLGRSIMYACMCVCACVRVCGHKRAHVCVSRTSFLELWVLE